jgi:type IV secretion system protein VirB10
MRRDRRPIQVIVSGDSKRDRVETKTQRIVIEGMKGKRLVPMSPPKYYGNRDDAQAAATLRTMKLQALTAKPVVEDFRLETRGGENSAQSGTAPTGATARTGNSSVMDAAAMAGLARQDGEADPNGQARKIAFLRGDGGSATPQGYSANFPVPRQFAYELKAGTILPGMLITGINSDLPGSVMAQVSENVWDTATGKYVLVPKGTRILGVYDSQVSFGQRRILLVWNRLVFPNGTTLDIAGSPGVDQAGYSGLSGRVNEHWRTRIGTALWASMFVAGAEVVYDRDSQGNSENRSPRDIAAESAAGSVLDMGAKLVSKASDLQPTITVRPGKRLGIFVQQDIVFPSPYF